MSAESLRARLEAATVDKLQMGNYDDPVLQPADVDFLEHVRTDLWLALNVIEAAKFVRHASDCAQVSWAHLVLEGHRKDEKPECNCWRHDLEAALDAFEAAP